MYSVFTADGSPRRNRLGMIVFVRRLRDAVRQAEVNGVRMTAVDIDPPKVAFTVPLYVWVRFARTPKGRR